MDTVVTVKMKITHEYYCVNQLLCESFRKKVLFPYLKYKYSISTFQYQSSTVFRFLDYNLLQSSV